MNKHHKITGKVVSASSKKGIGGLRVEAWDKDLIFDDFIGQATTNENGEFTIQFDTGKFSELIFDNSPDLYFKIFKGKKFLSDTKDSVIWNEDESAAVVIHIDLEDTSRVNYVPYKINGSVHFSNGLPAEDATVKLFEITLKGETELASTQADEEGQFNFSVSAPESVDVKLKAYIGEKLMASSPVQYNIGKEHTVELVGDDQVKGPSEFEQLQNVFAPLLTDIDPGSIDEDGIRYIVEKTGTSPQQTLMMLKSHELSSEKIPSEFFYSILRSGAGINDNNVFRVNVNKAITAYKKMQGDFVPTNGVDLEAIKKSYLAESTSKILASSSKMSVSNMSSMLEMTLDDPKDQEKFVELYFHGDVNGSVEDTWSVIEKTFGTEKTKALRLDGMLGYLTFNNAPLIQKLKEHSPNISDPADLVSAGFYKIEKLESVLDDSIQVPASIKGSTSTEKRSNYIKWIAGQLQFSYPNEVVANLVGTGEIKLKHSQELQSALLYKENGFKIGEYSINQHIRELKNADIQISASAEEELKSLHRTYSLAPNVESMNFLMQNNMDSAFKIIDFPESYFTQMYSNQYPEAGESTAKMIYYKAQQDAGLITNVATAYGAQWSNQSPWIFGNGSGGTDDSVDGIKEYPTLEKLFGSLDYCTCGHCQSLLSPTAYLVDLLQFIDIDEAAIEGSNPISVLFDRRPDIQHSELTCENTHTVLPYIDLVNEILEYYVVNEDLAGFEGYNMDEDITTEELLANPQFVNDVAYQKLNGELSAGTAYPMKLPFSRNLELLREFFNHFETPLFQVMERLREDESLESNSTDYSWREILSEQLGISPKEYELFTDHEAYTIQARYGLEDSDVLNDQLANAKEFSRTLDITYKELVSILETEFINPGARHIRKLELLQRAFNAAKEDNSTINSNYGSTSLYELLKGVADEDSSIIADLPNLFPEAHIDADKFGGNIQEWISTTIEEVMSLIFLSPTGEGDVCDFANLELKYANPDQSDLEEIDYWRFIHFVRLWRKMEWSIEQTDLHFTALYDSTSFDISSGDLNNLDNGFKDFLVKLALSERVRTELGISEKKGYQQNLTLWSSINSYGKDSLYRKLFLGATVLDINDVYLDDGYGNYLSDSGNKLLDFSPSLQAALSLAVEEWDLIIDDLGFDSATILSLENVSAIYRIGFLARELKVSVEELLTLKELSGIDPFAAVNYQSGGDYQQTSLIKFVNMVRSIDDSDFTVQDLSYLFNHQDKTGKSQPSLADSLSFARTLYLGLKEISDAYPVGVDLTDEEAQALVVSIYGAEFGGLIYSLLGGTVIFSTEYDHSSDALESDITDVSGNIGYNDLAKELTYKGAMTTAVRDALQGVSGVSADFIAAVQALYDNSQAEYAEFFAQHPEFEQLHSSGSSFEDIIESQLVPLVDGLKRIYLKQTLGGALDLDVEFMDALLSGELEDDTKYILHSSGTDTEAIIEDFLALGNNGVYAQYYNGTTVSGSAVSEEVIKQLAFDGVTMVLPSNTTDSELNISASWKFYIEAATNENYNLYLETDASDVKLWIDGEEVTMNQSGSSWGNASAINFSAGLWYEVEIQAADLHDTAILKWQTNEQLIETVPSAQCFPQNGVENYLSSYIKLLKAVRLIEGLGLTQGDTELLADASDMKFAGFSLFETLPTESGVATATVQGFMQRLLSLLDYAGMKQALNTSDDTLSEILSNPLVTDENGDLKLMLIADWEEETLVGLIQRFTGESSSDTAVLYPLLSDRSLFQRVLEGYETASMIGATIADLFTWTTVNPTFDNCTAMQSAIRSMYSYSAWLEVIQPINDRMRKRQRDALVSYILFHLSKNEATNHIDTTDKLYEFFLIDVDMSPCMKTSRIKQAISSTQLFIQRVLLNLEAEVDVASINSDYWSWMKNYRVWEANRKVFIYPENWLDPSLRDTKSPFFKDFESELLQSDINDDRASIAVMNYLEKLDKVANLTICGMCREDDNMIHVIGKTGSGKSAEFYYRNYSGSGWSAWEKVNLDIGDGPVIPVFWKNRLFLFWTSVVKAGGTEDQLPGYDGNPVSELNGPAKFDLEVSICWSEYYNGKWETKRTSDFDEPVVFPNLTSFYPSQMSLYYSLGDDGELAIYPNHSSKGALGMFILYNKHSDPQVSDFSDISEPDFPVSVLSEIFGPNRSIHQNGFGITYRDNAFDYDPTVHTNILGNYFYKYNKFNHAPHDIYSDPLFIRDFRHLFFVEMKKVTTTVPSWYDYGVEIWNGVELAESPYQFEAEIVEQIPNLDQVMEIFEMEIPDPVGPRATGGMRYRN